MPRATESFSGATHEDLLGGAMGVSVWENHEGLELVDRAACQIPQTILEKTNHLVGRISGFPK